MTNDQHLNNFCNEMMYRSVMFLARFITFYKNRRGIVTTCSSSSASASGEVLGEIVKAKDHVQFYIKFNSESFHICCVDSYGCPD